MKDEHKYGEKMARNGRTKVIYKGTFVSNQSLSPPICRNKRAITPKSLSLELFDRMNESYFYFVPGPVGVGILPGFYRGTLLECPGSEALWS